MEHPKSTSLRCEPCSGFTLIELIAVMAVMALLAMTFFPARASSRTKAQSVRCLDNERQIIGGVAMFSHDHNDLLPPNPDDGTTVPGYTWCTGIAGIGGGAQFDPDILSDPKQCLIAPYLNTNASLFRCTADARTGLYDGAALYPNSPLKGTRVPAARTVSMSQAVGTIDPGFNSSGGHSGIPNLPVNGPWLTGSYRQNSSSTGPYRTYGKFSQMVIPVPAQLIVIAEESPFSINDASLAMSVNPLSSVWIDYPNTLHNNGCVVSLADGHVEFHKWAAPNLILTAAPFGAKHVLPTDPDWVWFTQRISSSLR
jgi:prepilin-type N-terminal cleavage/methylation domain-containing protein/prepilin-type processing-associated H-X9-DG protein